LPTDAGDDGADRAEAERELQPRPAAVAAHERRQGHRQEGRTQREGGAAGAGESILAVQQIFGQQRADCHDTGDRGLPGHLCKAERHERAALQQRVVGDGVDHQWNVGHETEPAGATHCTGCPVTSAMRSKSLS
jgi:hypothetical protein